MENIGQTNIAKQLGETLGILKDYPGIEKIIDLKGVESFFKEISKSVIGGIPSFKEIDANKIAEFVAEEKSSIKEWQSALNELKGVYVDVDESDNGDDCVLFGGVPKNLSYLNSGSGNGDLYMSFDSGNKASFDDKEGTWEEIYVLITKHVHENLVVPDLPKETV